MTNSSNEPRKDVALALGIDGKRSRFRRFLKLFFWLLVIGAIGAGAVMFSRREASNGVQYVTQPVTRGDLVVTVNATGTLEPVNSVEVGIEVSGTIKAVDVDFNDNVEVGQVLAELDTSKLEAQTLQSKAALNVAQAKLLQAQATVQEAKAQMGRLDEVRKLSDGKLPAKTEYDTQKASLARANADEASAKAAVAQAQATVDANESDLKKAVVKSPVKGVVLTRSVEPGQTVAAMFQSPVLFTLAEDLTQMKLLVDVDEADVGRVREGQEATFSVDAYPDQMFSAQTTQVRYGSQTVEGVVTYKAVLKVDNSALTLRPGMTATATIVVDKRENALLVPNQVFRFSPPQVDATAQPARRGSLLSAILPHPPAPKPTLREDPTKSKEQKVWTLRDGVLTPIPVTKGLSDGKMTEVVSGDITQGMELVSDKVVQE